MLSQSLGHTTLLKFHMTSRGTNYNAASNLALSLNFELTLYNLEYNCSLK